MKEIVVISGKGGTGKTSVTASFSYFGGESVITADCDVDAADMHLLLNPDFEYSEDFYSGEISSIDQSGCIRCGKCADVCRFDAITVEEGIYRIDPLRCEGCGYCARVCPAETIINKERLAGKWYISNIRTGGKMVHARLGIGADNSGKLVAKVKNEARELAMEERADYVIVDGSPGVGCPVVSSLSGANFVILVTEPSVSGLHDLKRVYELVKKFHIKAGCIINKADINPEQHQAILKFLAEEDIPHLTDLPYDGQFTQAITAGKTVAEFSSGALKDLLSACWEKVKKLTI
ncbi:Iron-sulfur cluster carrier protein [anaerobic digester metagenome]